MPSGLTTPPVALLLAWLIQIPMRRSELAGIGAGHITGPKDGQVL